MFDDHDPICPFSNGANGPVCGCQCGLIAMVRADERARTPVVYGYTAVLSNLRAKVEALPPWLFTSSPLMLAVSRADVLALIDGGSDE